MVRKLIALHVLMCSVLVISPAADAATPVIYVQAVKLMAPNQAGAKLTIPCPADRHVVGGGVVPSNNSFNLTVASSGPVDGNDADSVPDDGWRVVGHSGSGNEKKMRGFAICAKGSNFTYVSSALIDVPNGGRTDGQALCATGILAGGGVLLSGTSAGFEVRLAGTAPLDYTDVDTYRNDGWFASAWNLSGSAVHMTVTAICDTSHAYSYVERSDVPLDPHSSQGVTILCPSGATLTAGGVQFGGGTTDPVTIQTLRPDGTPDDRTNPIGDGWFTVATNGSSNLLSRTEAIVCRYI